MTEVTSHNIDPLRLPSLPLEWHKALPKCAAIYMVLSSDNEILYIGQSANIQSRWCSHHRRKRLIKIPGLRIAWLQVSDPKLLQSIEIALIRFYNPKLNRPEAKKKRNPNTSLIALRKRENLTQRQLAKAIGVTDQTVSNWEVGIFKITLTPEQADKLCEVLNCSLKDLAVKPQAINPQNPPSLSEI